MTLYAVYIGNLYIKAFRSYSEAFILVESLRIYLVSLDKNPDEVSLREEHI